MINEIVATPRGFTMRVISEDVEDGFTTCQYLTSPDTIKFKTAELRPLTSKERQPLVITPDFLKLISERNITVATIPTKKAKKKRELSLAQKIAKATSNEEVLLIIKEAGIKTAPNN